MRVLIVDDDPLVRRSFRRLLPRALVEEASNTSEALAAITQRTYDALIVDMCLHAGSGCAGAGLARTLRAQGWAGALILVSAFSGRQIELEAANAGADAFVSKALLDRAGLRAVLERAVAARSAARVPEQDHPRSSLEVALQEVLDCGADETCVHAEKAYYMALFAKEALANGKEPIGVETCARLLGVTGETLRKYSIVASRWSHPELWRLLVERRGANGYRISASHLYELARLPLPLRAAWVERTFAEALSVRALKEALGELGPPGPDGTPGHDADHAI